MKHGVRRFARNLAYAFVFFAPMSCMWSGAIGIYLRTSAVGCILPRRTATTGVADYEAASDSSQSMKLAASAETSFRAARVTT